MRCIRGFRQIRPRPTSMTGKSEMHCSNLNHSRLDVIVPHRPAIRPYSLTDQRAILIRACKTPAILSPAISPEAAATGKRSPMPGRNRSSNLPIKLPRNFLIAMAAGLTIANPTAGMFGNHPGS